MNKIRNRFFRFFELCGSHVFGAQRSRTHHSHDVADDAMVPVTISLGALLSLYRSGQCHSFIDNYCL
jgi:hypothetical protein